MAVIDGNDVSSYQPNWEPKKGQEFMGVKVSEGTSYLNPYKDEQESKGRAADLVVLKYHFLHHGNIDAQVAYFTSNAKVKSGDILVCDAEKAGVTNADKDQFIKAVKKRYPKNRVLLYCSTSWWTGVDTSGYAGDGLWCAYYSDNTNVRPPIQTPWLFWQFSQTPIDQNIAAFTTKAQLKSWASGDTVPVVIDRRAKVAFRGGWTCGCVATSLPLVEQDMIKRGLIKESIDIWQLGYRGDVAASAGTHAKGGNTDVDQYSPEQIKVWWEWGWNIQHRTRAQGFDMDHGHGSPVGCPHMSPGGQSQMNSWRNGRDGLLQNLKVPNWPGWLDWETAIARKAGTSGAASAAADKAAKDDKEEDVARKRIARTRTKDQKNVKAGEWQAVWVVNDSERTVATGPCEADFNVNLRVQNLTEGETIYVRAATYDIVKGKVVRNKNSETEEQEIHGQKGTQWGPALPFSCVVGKPAKGHSSRRLLIEWMCNDPSVVITNVEITGWSVQK